jgi:hypothetical protein
MNVVLGTAHRNCLKAILSGDAFEERPKAFEHVWGDCVPTLFSWDVIKTKDWPAFLRIDRARVAQN